MLKFGDEKGQLKCSFCGKSQEQVRKLVAGPGVYICDECIELCNEIIEEEFSEDIEVELKDVPKPKEILRLREVGNDILAKHTGQPREKLIADTERDNFMTAEEAKEYGLIDEVITRPVKIEKPKE